MIIFQVIKPLLLIGGISLFLSGAAVGGDADNDGVDDSVELSDVASGIGGFVINGAASIDRSGGSVSDAGDVNGDGLPDAIIGAPGADPNGFSSGASYVVFGTSGNTPIELADVAAGLGGGFVINGAAADDMSGFSVSGAGDVDGDGLADVIVGAFRADANGSDSGASYVVFGETDNTPIELADIAAGSGGGFVINGAGYQNVSGFSVSGAGDVDGDGLADVIVGATGAIPNGNSSGASYIVFGKTGNTPIDLADVAAGLGGGFVINGAAAGDFSGGSVSGAGDVDGDGLADVIVGASSADPNGDQSGASYVVFGKSGNTPIELADIAAGLGGGFVINGAAADDKLGYSVSGAGDVDGDGLADVIVGAYGADANGSFSGASYVLFGTSGNTPIELADVAAGLGGGFVINGAAADDRSGWSVSGAGDVDGDGLADVIVGAQTADPNGSSSGASYVVFGKTGNTPIDLADVTAGLGGGFVINGAASNDNSGISVSGAGDVDGDGLADVIVGANSADPNGGASGATYMVSGAAGVALVDLCPATAPGASVDVNGCSDAQVDGDSDGYCDIDAPSSGPSGCTGADNCPLTANDQTDQDGDTVGDVCDNCLLEPNPSQCNTNGDIYGNACDADFDNNDIVNSFDLSFMRSNFGAEGVNDADMNCDGLVNSFDLSAMRAQFGSSPGPSGLAP